MSPSLIDIVVPYPDIHSSIESLILFDLVFPSSIPQFDSDNSSSTPIRVVLTLLVVVLSLNSPSLIVDNLDLIGSFLFVMYFAHLEQSLMLFLTLGWSLVWSLIAFEVVQ